MTTKLLSPGKTHSLLAITEERSIVRFAKEGHILKQFLADEPLSRGPLGLVCIEKCRRVVDITEERHGLHRLAKPRQVHNRAFPSLRNDDTLKTSDAYFSRVSSPLTVMVGCTASQRPTARSMNELLSGCVS